MASPRGLPRRWFCSIGDLGRYLATHPSASIEPCLGNWASLLVPQEAAGGTPSVAVRAGSHQLPCPDCRYPVDREPATTKQAADPATMSQDHRAVEVCAAKSRSLDLWRSDAESRRIPRADVCRRGQRLDDGRLPHHAGTVAPGRPRNACCSPDVAENDPSVVRFSQPPAASGWRSSA